MADSKGFIPLDFQSLTETEMQATALRFYLQMSKRRSVREFSSQPVPESVIQHALLAAGTAPSGANMQPWHFVVIRDAQTRQTIREAAEAEERELYEHRASDEWLDALAPLGTDANKPFLETAPVLIAVFLQKFSLDAAGNKRKHYYTAESVGIATGLLITALHQSGLATLTHTPSPMKFLNQILHRPSHERAMILLVCGYPASGVTVPDIKRKTLEEIATFI